jgi:anti-sigma factor RsiW
MQHPNHPDHDLLLVSAHAAGDLAESERTRAQALLTTCEPCADLHRDLIAIAAATRVLPKLATAPRDFRLAPEQAARLRRGSWLRAVLAPFGAARSATRPMAAAFTSLGLAGLLVATFLPGMLGTAASAPQRESLGGAGQSAAPAGPVTRPVEGAPNPTTVVPDDAYGVKDLDPTDAPDVAVAGGRGTDAPGVPEDTAGRQLEAAPLSPLLIGSFAVLAVGLLLFGLRFVARRVR